MKIIKSKKGLALLATVVVAGITAYGAVAYFTSTGSGTGSATVGTASTITLDGTITGTLYPGGDPAGVSVLVTNPGHGSQHVGSIHLASISTDPEHGSCNTSVGADPAAFEMEDIAVDTTLAAGGDVTKTGSLQMNNLLVSQDGCQGAPLTLHFTSN